MAHCLDKQDNSYRDDTGVNIAREVIAAHAMVQPAAAKIASPSRLPQ